MPAPIARDSYSRISSLWKKVYYPFDTSHDVINEMVDYWTIPVMLSGSIHTLCDADAVKVLEQQQQQQEDGEPLWLLALKIDAAAEDIAKDLEEKMNHHQYPKSELVIDYQTKTKSLVAEIGEDLDLYLSSSGAVCCNFLTNSASRPHVSDLEYFAQYIDLVDDSKKIHSLYTELSRLLKYIKRLYDDDDDAVISTSIVVAFHSHIASVLVSIAIQLCNYRIHCKMTTDHFPFPTGVFRDLHHQIDPTNPDFMEFHLNLLKALNKIPEYSVEIVDYFCDYLFEDQQGRFRKELSSLIHSVLDSCKIEEEDVVQSFFQEINAVLVEMASLFEPVRRLDQSDCPPICYELLAKILLVRAELFLRQQIIEISSASNSGRFSSDLLPNWRSKIDCELYRILKKMRKFLQNVDHGGKIIDLLEQLRDESASLFSSFQLKQIIEEYKLKNSLLQLLLKIVMFKTESFLMELMLLNEISSSDAATIMYYGGKDRIAILLQLLEYFKQILSDQKLKNREDVYMPFVQIEICARGMACFSYSFHPSKITEDVIRKMFISSCEVLDKVKHLNSKSNEIGPHFHLSKSPKIYRQGFIDFLVRNLGELLNFDPLSIAPVKHHIEEIQLHLKSLTSFLRRVLESDIDKHPELKDLDDQVTDIAYKVEYIIDSIEIDTQWYHFLWFYHLLDELRIVNQKASGIHLTTLNIAKAQSSKNVTQVSPDLVVDLNNEEQFIIDQLTRGSPRRAIVSIVGMPGTGKTTMARKVYNNQNVMHHFHCLAWCTVSQVYEKRELLLEILSDIHGLTDEIHRMNNEDLESKLRQCLLKKKYLIVMDDIWDAGAWNDLQNSFPDDVNGSRILITSRLRVLAIEIEPDGDPHTLRPFSDDESWNFLERKVFQGESCPVELLAVGAKIAHHCQGLPLAIVAIAGVLQRTAKIKELWEEIAESLSTKVMEDPEIRCMEIIELSYKYLPEYLKPCFLYLGVFLEDRDIQVSKSVRFWLAEGFIENTESKNVEDVAEAYLADLISRSLVMISKTRSNGKVKACRLHDLIRDLCRSKAKVGNFFQLVTRVIMLLFLVQIMVLNLTFIIIQVP